MAAGWWRAKCGESATARSALDKGAGTRAGAQSSKDRAGPVLQYLREPESLCEELAGGARRAGNCREFVWLSGDGNVAW